MRTLRFQSSIGLLVALFLSCSREREAKEPEIPAVLPVESQREVSPPMPADFTFQPESVSFDGGPLIVIQPSVLPKWEGGKDFDNSILNGGTIRTDYDVICEAEELTTIHYLERDMIVLGDSEWGARTGTYRGDLIITQGIGEEELADECTRLLSGDPTTRIRFDNQDQQVRLMVGVDSVQNYSSTTGIFP
jgi:hypothetical protein